jgi:hypothetical protein
MIGHLLRTVVRVGHEAGRESRSLALLRMAQWPWVWINWVVLANIVG